MPRPFHLSVSRLLKPSLEIETQVRMAVGRLFWGHAPTVDGAVDPRTEGREALEGHHIDRIVEGKRDPKATRRGQGPDPDHLAGEGLTEILAADPFAENHRARRRTIADGGVQGVPIFVAVLMGHEFQRPAVTDRLAIILQAGAQTLGLVFQILE